MTDCSVCQKKESMLKVAQVEKNFAFLADPPAVTGHLIVSPNSHNPILDTIPDFDVGSLFIMANKLSTALFETLPIQGTNIIIQNGVGADQSAPHCILHVLPRKENDGLDFTWSPRTIDEEQMSTIELKIKEAAKNVGVFEKEKKEPMKIETKVEELKDTVDNYLIKQINRIP